MAILKTKATDNNGWAPGVTHFQEHTKESRGLGGAGKGGVGQILRFRYSRINAESVILLLAVYKIGGS